MIRERPATTVREGRGDGPGGPLAVFEEVQSSTCVKEDRAGKKRVEEERESER